MSDYITRRTNEDLYKRFRLGAYFYVIGVLVSALNDALFTQALLQVTVAALFFVVLAIVRFYLPRPPQDKYKAVSWRKRVGAISMFSSLGWGLCFAWVASQSQYEATLQTMLLCTVAFATASAYQFCLTRTVAQVNCALFIVPFAITLVIYQPEKYPLAIAAGVYCLYLVLSIIQLHRQYLSSLDTELGLFKAQNDLKSLSLTDELTGLANRRHFRAHLEQSHQAFVEQNQTYAILLIDLDFFKRINDRYGHQIGDQCIQLAASVLTRVFQREGDLVSRIGGEEFAVVLQLGSLSEAVALAENVRTCLTENGVSTEEGDIFVTASIGIALADSSFDESENQLFKRADELLFAAKNAGRDCIKF